MCKGSGFETTLIRDGGFDILVDLIVDSEIHAVRVIVTVEVSKTNEENTRLQGFVENAPLGQYVLPLA
jgi:hypothetical protein